MIHIYKNYYLGADANGFTLYKEGKSKKGERTIVADSYPATVAHAVKSVMRKEQLEIASKEELLLSQYINKIEQLNKTFQSILDGIKTTDVLTANNADKTKTVPELNK